ncbi:GNAT family N-acetyltransferase [Paracoccus zhejiangensis]|uniref:GNAT family N-acetyltransferase n=1 Tax=Paracoccus zhejiangensis TaxID=1077935 RepID=A0A2H5EV26_9RHOB|nr:GNAT family N-acetyltransferase [Paracoccus zhejiangensis]AUH63144.1 GNAT family N-acetyltransferase [Paracoccus zhejiangensis]
MSAYTIEPARFPEDAETVRRLFRAYAHWLAVDLDFQDFEAELDALPGAYAPPDGAVLLLRNAAGEAQGCVALRKRADGECEMKRMYLDDAARGSGQGRALALAIIATARAAGYRRMVLDSLDRLGSALRLYDSLGFREIAPYYHNPLPGVVYRGLDL